MDRQQLRDKFRGALLGVAVGDSLGAPFEGSPGLADPLSLPRADKEPGQLRYTDDTHMTLGVADSLVTKQGFDGAHMAETFARNYEEEPWRGYGAGPPQVFHLLRRGIPWNEAGRMLFGGSGSYGNGAAMRVTPIALAYYENTADMLEAARESASITHAHKLGIEGAALQAIAVTLLLREPPELRVSGSALTEVLITHANDAGASIYVDKLRSVKELLPKAPPFEVVSRVGHGIEAYEAVPAALYCFLKHSTSFSEAVRLAIRLGGDTDTIASMTGALSGAYLGESAIPSNWLRGLEGFERIRGLADALFEIALGKSRQRGRHK
ncbi:MAG: ADP-ribosylglycohydrolase family protein [Deltaproteobacteria bacterium]|nr:ADP-ribosylglycohydrolase family protein [Deltaproteobacteria bacterium]MDZ4344555.1 ADP-ribosylglycohydrolase family protein [Candidatus Binatia bacterium]